MAGLRRAWQRAVLDRRRDADGLPPAGGDQRPPHGAHPGGHDRLHRPEPEPGRTTALPAPARERRRAAAGSEPAGGRARRALAGRTPQPLPVRHEPRLDRRDAAGDPRPHRRAARADAAGVRGPARDGRRLDLLLRARGRALQPAPRAEPAPEPRPVRAQQRGVVRPLRHRLLHPRGVRRLLPGLWRELAGLLRRRGHDLRTSARPRPGVPALRRHLAPLPRVGAQPLRDLAVHGRGDRDEPRALPARLPPLSRQRGRGGPQGKAAVVAHPDPGGPVRGRQAGGPARLPRRRGVARDRAVACLRAGLRGRKLRDFRGAAVEAPAARAARRGRADARGLHGRAGTAPGQGPGARDLRCHGLVAAAGVQPARGHLFGGGRRRPGPRATGLAAAGGAEQSGCNRGLPGALGQRRCGTTGGRGAALGSCREEHRQGLHPVGARVPGRHADLRRRRQRGVPRGDARRDGARHRRRGGGRQ